MGILTNSSTPNTESTGSGSTPTETITYPYHPFEGNVTSLTHCLPLWVVKTIEVVGPYVRDISFFQ
jgi:hypothetical protein